MLRDIVTTRLIKTEDLNHHGTLFAGRMAEWFVESCFLAACNLIRKPEDIVCVQIHGMTFKKPATRGDVIEIISTIAALGEKSITVSGKVLVNNSPDSAIDGMATFVTVDEYGKPYAHGFTLSEEYIAANREIYEKALILKQKSNK